jgi:argininosuccinate lyase
MSQASKAGSSSEAPAPELIESGFALEVGDAPLLHDGLNLADLARVLVLREREIIPADASIRLLRVLLEVSEMTAEDFPYDPQWGDPYNCRERFFQQRLGTDAGWLHAGRPRREAGRMALRLALRRIVTGLIEDTADFANVVATMAATHAETLVPDQTYLQQAQPSTFGHYLLTFAYPALRDADRLRSGLGWVNQSPGGAGCVNGSRLLVPRDREAQLLGFDAVIEHTRDAMWQTDGLIDLLATGASLLTNMSKLAEDLEIWDSQEFDFVDLAGPFTRASVLMPQKRNPYSLSIVRGAAGVAIGRLSGFLSVVKTPSARSDNLIFAYGEVPRSLELARRVTRLMTGIVRTLQVNADRMKSSLMRGFSQATDLAEYVMQTTGIDYRTAYDIVGATVREAAEAMLSGTQITGAMLDGQAEKLIGRSLGLAARDLTDVLDPAAIVMTRTSPGGAAPKVVRPMASAVEADSSALRDAALALRESFDQAELRLISSARELASS